jgi:hypothetical protein
MLMPKLLINSTLEASISFGGDSHAACGSDAAVIRLIVFW